MNKNRFIYASLAAALTLTAACGTNTSGEPTATPSASAAPSSTTSATDDARAAAAAGLPNSGAISLEDARAAAASGVPFVFGTGRGCAWLRLPDGSLWALHDTTARTGSSALARDVGAEAAWKADPDFEPGACKAATGLPTADDPAQPEPYRWTADYGNTYVRWHGQAYILPGTVSVGLALRPIPN